MNHDTYHLGIVINRSDDFGVIRDYDCGKQFLYKSNDIVGTADHPPEELFDYSPTGFHEGVSVKFRIDKNRATDIQPANGHSEPLTATVKKYVMQHLHR